MKKFCFNCKGLANVRILSQESKSRISKKLKTLYNNNPNHVLRKFQGENSLVRQRFTSKGEKEMVSFIKEHLPNYKWKSGGGHDIGDGYRKQFDLYDPFSKIIVEYDGACHFSNYHGQLEKVQLKDERLGKWANENGWCLIRINEKTWRQIPGSKLLLLDNISLRRSCRLYLVEEL